VTAGMQTGMTTKFTQIASGGRPRLEFVDVLGLVIREAIDVVIGLHVSKEIEREGLNLALNSETVQ
jgi:hypothetical protein